MTRPRWTLVAPLALTALLALTACGPAAPAPTPSASRATSSPTAIPTPEAAPALETIVVLADTLTAVDDDGTTMATLTYFDSGPDTVAALTELFGFDPVVTVVPRAPSDAFAGTQYAWDGFELNWRGFEDEPGSGTSSYPLSHSLSVQVTAPEVRGVSIEGPSGIHVGDAFEPLKTSYAESYNEFDNYDENNTPDGTRSGTVTVGTVPLPPTDGNDGTWMWGVTVRSEVASGTITAITTPTNLNFGL